MWRRWLKQPVKQHERRKDQILNPWCFCREAWPIQMIVSDNVPAFSPHYSKSSLQKSAFKQWQFIRLLV